MCPWSLLEGPDEPGMDLAWCHSLGQTRVGTGIKSHGPQEAGCSCGWRSPSLSLCPSIRDRVGIQPQVPGSQTWAQFSLLLLLSERHGRGCQFSGAWAPRAKHPTIPAPSAPQTKQRFWGFAWVGCFTQVQHRGVLLLCFRAYSLGACTPSSILSSASLFLQASAQWAQGPSPSSLGCRGL